MKRFHGAHRFGNRRERVGLFILPITLQLRMCNVLPSHAATAWRMLDAHVGRLYSCPTNTFCNICTRFNRHHSALNSSFLTLNSSFLTLNSSFIHPFGYNFFIKSSRPNRFSAATIDRFTLCSYQKKN